MKRRAFLVAVVGAVAFTLGAGAEPGLARTTPLTQVVPTTPPIMVNTVAHGGRFSPNGDGVQDGVRMSYRLPRAARVVVIVRSEKGELVRRSVLGVQGSGTHVWGWSGRKKNQRYVAAGRYRLSLFATTTGRRPVRGHISVRLHAQPKYFLEADLETDRATIYPDTTAVTDVARIAVAKPLNRAPLVRIVSPRGQRVFTASGPAPSGYLEWSGRTDAGDRVPDGTYRIKATWRDSFGNSTTLTKPVKVASGALRAVSFTRTVTPAESLAVNGYHCQPPRDGNDCLDADPASPSDRFPGGLTFAAGDRYPNHTRPWTSATFRLALPWAPDAAHDRLRISFTGGATNPADDSSRSAGGVDAYPWEVRAFTAPEGSTTTPWGGLAGWYTPLNPPTRLQWRFANAIPNTSYDVSSFTVELEHWAPPVDS